MVERLSPEEYRRRVRLLRGVELWLTGVIMLVVVGLIVGAVMLFNPGDDAPPSLEPAAAPEASDPSPAERRGKAAR